jgi:hypothetical protein
MSNIIKTVMCTKVSRDWLRWILEFDLGFDQQPMLCVRTRFRRQ